MRSELKAYQRHFRITTLFVTHNYEEARQLADRIGVIRQGRLTVNVNPSELESIVSAGAMPMPRIAVMNIIPHPFCPW